MSEIVVQNTVVSHVLVIIAMEAEARPLLEALKLEKISLKTANVPSVAYQGVYNDCKVTVVTNGVCNEHKVDNVGTTPGKHLRVFCFRRIFIVCFSCNLCFCRHQRVQSRLGN